MSLTSLEPDLFGSVQPPAQTWTVITQLTDQPNAFVSVFVSTQVYSDRVRMAIKAIQEPLQDHHYILYDTRMTEGHPVQIAQLGIQATDHILVWSEQGETAFTVTGVSLINS